MQSVAARRRRSVGDVRSTEKQRQDVCYWFGRPTPLCMGDRRMVCTNLKFRLKLRDDVWFKTLRIHTVFSHADFASENTSLACESVKEATNLANVEYLILFVR